MFSMHALRHPTLLLLATLLLDEIFPRDALLLDVVLHLAHGLGNAQ